MIEYIFINIKNGGLTHTISIDTDIDDNLPYDLADAFSEVIRLTNANPDMVVEQLINEYGLPESMQTGGDYENENNKRIWHDASEEPIYDGALLGVNSDGVSIYKWCNQEGSWESFAKYCVLKRWAYINDLLPKGGEE